MGLDNIIFLLFIKGKRQFASLISLNVALFFFFCQKTGIILKLILKYRWAGPLAKKKC